MMVMMLMTIMVHIYGDMLISFKDRHFDLQSTRRGNFDDFLDIIDCDIEKVGHALPNPITFPPRGRRCRNDITTWDWDVRRWESGIVKAICQIRETSDRSSGLQCGHGSPWFLFSPRFLCFLTWFHPTLVNPNLHVLYNGSASMWNQWQPLIIMELTFVPRYMVVLPTLLFSSESPNWCFVKIC